MNQVKELSEMPSKSNPSSKNLSPSEFHRRNKILKESGDTNGKKTAIVVSQASTKKLLGDRNCDNAQLSNLSKTLFKANLKNGKSSENSHEKDQSSEYDPVTNYTSPRPAFLRYNPNRREEILARMKDCEEESLSDENLFSSLSISSKSKDEVENEEEGSSGDYEELEVDSERFWCSMDVCKWFFPFVILLLLNFYLFSASIPLHEKNPSIENFHCQGSMCILKTLMGVGDVCFDNGNKMCGLVISDPDKDSGTWIYDENNKELSSAEGDVNTLEQSPFERMHEFVISGVVNDGDTWIIDENVKDLSSDEGDDSTEELSPFEENTVSSSNFNSGRYSIGFDVGEEIFDLPASDVLTSDDLIIAFDDHEPSAGKSVESMCESIDIVQKQLNDDQNKVLTNKDIITLDGRESSVKKSVESMHESTDNDQKLLGDDQNEVAMSTGEFLMHEYSSESGKEVNMVRESDKDEKFGRLDPNRYEVGNKFGLLLAVYDAVNMKQTLFSGCMLLVMLALWITLSTFYSKSGKTLKGSNVTQLSSDHPKDEQGEQFLSCSESVKDNDSIETINERKDPNLFNQSFSVSSEDENVKFYASRTPAVQLLSEFSIVGDLKYSTTKKVKRSENSGLFKSQDKENENSPASRPRKVVKTAMNSSCSNNANEQLKEEMMKPATPTPLRRSSRLQNRGTPPYR